MRNLAAPVVGYVATVLAVIGIASAGVFNLTGMTAKAQRGWDADIDRIVARQQERKRLVELASIERIGPPVRIAARAEPEVATALPTGSIEDVEADPRDTGPQKVQNQGTKKPGRRGERRREHFIPAAFVTLPKFAATTAASTLLRLR
jgi:hypothetical protein